jgi:hypothetical protein
MNDGPRVVIRRYCDECKYCETKSYTNQGDSGSEVYCNHPWINEGKGKYINDTCWITPDWCPFPNPK